MRQETIFLVVCVAATALTVNDALARGGRGGARGGGGAFSGGGGYARPSPAVSRSPSMSRPATPRVSRPSIPQPSVTRPNPGRVTSPATGQRPTPRPQTGGLGSNRPASGFAQGSRPSSAQLNQFLDLPSQGAARANLATGARPGGANSAVADFLQGGSTIAGSRADNISSRTDARAGLRGSRGENRDFASDNRQARVEGRGDRQAVRVSNRGEMRSSLAGTYQNKSTDQTESVEGMVDQKSQRAAWTIVGKNSPILETGISNLTMNESRVLVHFADGTTQQWLLVRVPAPEAETTPQ